MWKLMLWFMVFILFPLDGIAKLPPANLGDAVGFSNIIFTGSVFEKKEEPVLVDNFNSWGVLRISVSRVICGGFYPEEGWRDGMVEVLYQINPIERPVFSVGEEYVFFYRASYSGPALAPSFFGAVEISSENIDARIFGDIKRIMRINDFFDLIDCDEIDSKQSRFR